jgi:hypothetical protein
MPTDLNILKKAFQNVASTSEATKSWDEPLTRRSSIHTEQVISAPSLPSEVGGWVASEGSPYATVEYSPGLVLPVQSGGAPSSRTYFETRPGRAGFNDVDFVPYNWGTNRFGNKGGALLGHPISWEVVGPTGKSPFTHWQWAVDTGANTLKLEAGVMSQRFTTIPPHVAPATVPTVAQAYGLTTMPNGGLYVLVELTGGEASDLLRAPANALTPIDDRTARFELFRVDSWLGQDLVLDPTKLLTDYFVAVGANDAIKSITLIRPKVTRLAAIPLSLNGTTQRNQVFVFLPPETSANSEYMPPYVGSGVCPDWTVNGGFDFLGVLPTAEAGAYGTPSKLPVPSPVLRGQPGSLSLSPGVANQWVLNVTATGVITAGQIVRVCAVENATLSDGQVEQCLGWFEILTAVAGPPYVLTLRRVPEVDSHTGEVFYGNGPPGGVTDIVSVDVYNNIGTIFTDASLSIPKVIASRLDHLIDPSVVETSFRSEFSSNPPGPAIFNTADIPGNLTDLGFRVVLFPAKDVGGVVGPDFDNPINSNTVVLDPSLPPTGQFLEVDYSAGVLYLSLPPVPGAGCTVAPSGIIVDPVGNPRKEVVLYAACVPYSRESSQRGPGVQVRTLRVGGEFGPFDTVDIYGQRSVHLLDPSMYGALGTELLLSSVMESPTPTGWFQLGELGPFGTFSDMGEPNYYSWYDPSTYTLKGIGQASAYLITDQTRVVLLKGPPFPKTPYDSDGVRGSSKRAPALTFRGTQVFVQADGSVVISPASTLDDAYRANDPTTPGLGRTIRVDGGAVEARPITNTGDTVNASFRVNTSDAIPTSLVGFDFLGWDPGLDMDSYAGFLDRRVFAPTSATTTLTSNFFCDVAAGVVSIDPLGVAWFWEPTGYKKTLLSFNQDLIDIDGVTYVISGYSGATGHDITILNLDGTVPTITFGTGLYLGAQATVYRTKFYTSRGDTGSAPLNYNSWFSGQAQSETALGQPIGALNLYAGSATAISPGDGGGSAAALAFWARYNILGSEVTLSTAYVDTFGRSVSSLNPVYMTGTSEADYQYRGDFVSRSIKDSVSPLLPTIGHVVEDYTYDAYRYDFLSLMPLVGGSPTYTGTATANILTQGEMTVVLGYLFVPYGAAIAEVVSVNGDTTQRGMYLIYSTDNVAKIFIRGLDDALPTAFAPADSIVFRLHVFESAGRHIASKYLSSGSSPSTQSSTHTIGVGIDADSVGLSIAGPDRLLGGADRHAYRVTKAGVGGPTSPSNTEVASLDLGGYHKSTDYLYNTPLASITKQLSPAAFSGVDSFGVVQWAFDPTISTWYALNHGTALLVPLVLPKSSDRLDFGATRTHRTQLQYITIMGSFFAGVTPPSVSIRKVRCSPGSPPTRANTSLFVAQAPIVFPCTTSTNLAPSGVGGETYYISVFEDNMGTLPVYFDDTSDYFYYLLVQSNIGGASLDEVFGVQVTYTDPGPRNF